MTNIGELLKETRKAIGYTQKELAIKSGISFVTINRIEKGLQPRLSVVHKLFISMDKNLIITTQDK